MSSHITSGPGKSWHSHLTIDLLFTVLTNSILHPFVAWMLPLCLRAVQAPYESREFIGSCIYTSFITLIWILSVINKRLAYGLPREVNWNEEVVVITGGAGGLGRILAEMYGMRGASVAVLDVVEWEGEGMESVRGYVCDVGDAESVESVKGKIEKEVCPISQGVVDTRGNVMLISCLIAGNSKDSDQQCRYRKRQTSLGPFRKRSPTELQRKSPLPLPHNPDFPPRNARLRNRRHSRHSRLRPGQGHRKPSL